MKHQRAAQKQMLQAETGRHSTEVEQVPAAAKTNRLGYRPVISSPTAYSKRAKDNILSRLPHRYTTTVK